MRTTSIITSIVIASLLAACGGGDRTPAEEAELDSMCSAEAKQAPPGRIYIPSKPCQSF